MNNRNKKFITKLCKNKELAIFLTFLFFNSYLLDNFLMYSPVEFHAYISKLSNSSDYYGKQYDITEISEF
jgi:hypothetical protein